MEYLREGQSDRRMGEIVLGMRDLLARAPLSEHMRGCEAYMKIPSCARGGGRADRGRDVAGGVHWGWCSLDGTSWSPSRLVCSLSLRARRKLCVEEGTKADDGRPNN